MQKLIEELSKNADMVILDTAPAELMVDASAIAKFADAAMYVVRYDHVKMRQIQNGVQTLSMSGTDMIGYVFNGDKTRQSGGYGYGYKYYGGYGHYFESKRGQRDDQKSIKHRIRNRS